MADRLDLLLFGATGFTGKHCIPYLYKFCQSNGLNLTWGVAGRSKSKLEQVLKVVGLDIGTEFQDIPIITADVEDLESLDGMALRAKVVINCCGPFRALGIPVAKACINAGTHHVDISAEADFMEKLELTLKEDARDKGVYIVTACGFDCIPSDLGVVFLQQRFRGTLNSINMYLETWLEEGDRTKSFIGYHSSSVMNYCTWESLIVDMANYKEIAQNHKQLFPEAMSKFQPEIKQKYMPHKSDITGGWCLPLPSADRSSLKRTQKYCFQTEHKRPVQISTYYMVKSFLEVILVSLFVLLLYPFITTKMGCSILLRNPGLFTLGLIRKEPPSEKTIQNTYYEVTLYGEGWDDQVGFDDYDYKKSCDKCILARVTVKDAYQVTCIGVVLSAITIITEKDKLPTGGGVFSAGACFAKTSLTEQLIEHGVKLEVVYEKKL